MTRAILPNGFGLGTGTAAEGWIYDAVNFWEEQFSGTIPAKRELLNGSIEFGTQEKDGFIVDNVLHSDTQGDIHFR